MRWRVTSQSPTRSSARVSPESSSCRPPFANTELIWEYPPNHHYFERWGSFATVAQFDHRGAGCSDRLVGAASIEERMEDIRVVMDAVGWERATIYALQGGPLACLFAATYPERTERLILHGSYARIIRAPGYDIGVDRAGTTRSGRRGLRTGVHPRPQSSPLLRPRRWATRRLCAGGHAWSGCPLHPMKCWQ
jgi:pimeloyl-ACP methyl ester carboxylesterase